MAKLIRFPVLAMVAAMAVAAPPVMAGQKPPAPILAAAETASLTQSDGRVVPLTVVVPPKPKGLILFAHGGGTPLASVLPLANRLAAAGFVVVAPTFTDSADMPDGRRTSLQEAFATRIADEVAASAYAAQRFPALTQAAVGHSYGALTGLIAGGAFAPMVPGKVGAVKAVVMFSSPGPIPGLSQAPRPLDQVDVPTLLITGTADTVPGFVADPQLHLFYHQAMPAGDHTAVIVKGATHDLVRGKEPGADQAWALAIDFLKARIAQDRKAARRFAKAASNPEMDIRRR